MSKSSIKTQPPESINGNTTVLELVAAGLIKIGMLETWRKQFNRKNEKRADSLSQDRCDQAIAFFIGATYQPGERFRKKPIEKAVLQFGISRVMMDKSIKTLVELGHLVNNSDEVNNQTHTRHWIPEAE